LSSKIIVTATDENTAVVVDVVPGQAHDAPLLEPLLQRTIERVPVFDELVGDKGFDDDAQRRACIDGNVFPNIPNRVNRIDPWVTLLVAALALFGYRTLLKGLRQAADKQAVCGQVPR
jgi:hypothetical protein